MTLATSEKNTVIEVSDNGSQAEVSHALFGPLSSKSFFCLLGSKQQAGLESQDKYLDDEIVSFTLFHVSSFFYESLQNELEVISSQYLLRWQQNLKRQPKYINDDASINLTQASNVPMTANSSIKDRLEPNKDWLNKRLIAYPIFAAASISGSAHWTLGILYNSQWEKEVESKELAVEIAQFLTKTEKKSNIHFAEIPVPLQASSSNNCALYPAHYLKIFLTDLDSCISHCTSDLSNLEHSSPEVMSRWDSDRAMNLRSEALALFEFYKDIWSCSDKQ